MINIFERYRHVLDAELQQRACEYLAIAQRADENELLEVVCEEMPPFPERESALLNRLHSRGAASQDRRTWVIGGKGENKDREAARFKAFKQDGSAGGNEEAGPSLTNGTRLLAVPEPEPEVEEEGALDMMGGNTDGAEDVMESLAGLDLGGVNSPQETPLIDHGVESLLAAASMNAASNGSAGGAAPIAPSAAVTLTAMSLTKGPSVDKVSKQNLHSLISHLLTLYIPFTVA